MGRTKLFAVKTLYRTTATGRPKRRDKHYDPDTALIEERVVLFRASTFDSAIRKAEREARKYAADDSGHNGYGQALATEYLECCDFSTANCGSPSRARARATPSARVTFVEMLDSLEIDMESDGRRD